MSKTKLKLERTSRVAGTLRVPFLHYPGIMPNTKRVLDNGIHTFIPLIY